MRATVNLIDEICIASEAQHKRDGDLEVRLYDKDDDMLLGKLLITVDRNTLIKWWTNYSELEDSDQDASNLDNVLKSLVASILPFLPLPLTRDQLSSLEVMPILISDLSDAKEGFDRSEQKYFVDGMGSPEALVERLVYGEAITPEKIRLELLRRAQFEYDYSNPSNYHGALFIGDLIEEKYRHMFVKPLLVIRQGNWLLDNGYLEGVTKRIDSLGLPVFVKITPAGTQYLENKGQEQTSPLFAQFKQEIHISGSQHTFAINGDVIQTITNDLTELRRIISTEVTDTATQKALLEDIAEAEAAADANDDSKLKAALGKMLQHGANVAQVSSLVIQILSEASKGI